MANTVRSGNRRDPVDEFEFVRAHGTRHSIAMLGRVLGISASGSHAWCTRPALRARDRDMGVRPSMGSAGDVYDDAMCESFFATLECELVDRSPFGTQIEARPDVFDFIEGLYDPHRRHSALDYHSPIDDERRQLALQWRRKRSPLYGPGGTPDSLRSFPVAGSKESLRPSVVSISKA